MLPPRSEKKIQVSLSIFRKHKGGKKNINSHGGKKNKIISWQKYTEKTLKCFRTALKRKCIVSLHNNSNKKK